MKLNESDTQENHTNGTTPEKKGLARKFATLIEKQNIDPKTWIIMMFIIIAACAIVQTAWVFVGPTKKIVKSDSLLTKSQVPTMKSLMPERQAETIEYKELAERTQKARMIMNSGVPLTKQDSVFISETYDMITKFTNQTKP